MEALRKDTGVEARSGASGISLSDLRSRRTPVEWFEGIAVIQELCRALMDAGVTADQGSFTAEDVVLDPAGSVRVSLDRDDRESVVRQVGELLHIALAESSFPVPLRLVITQSTSTPPFYASIAELSSALEYFERPDRRGLVRDVYERARTLAVVAPSDEHPVQPKQAEQPKEKKKRAKEKAPRRPLPKSLIFGAAATVVVVAIGAGALAWQSARPQHSSSVAEAEKEGAKTSAHGKSASNSTRVDSSAVVESRRAGSVKSTGDRTGPSFTSAGQRRDADLEAPVMLAPVGELPARAASDGSPTVSAYELVTIEAEPVGPTIYSASDRDVTPPLATYPRLPVAPPAGVPAAAVSTLELLVNESGEVESVRLRGEPAQLADALLATMNLSAAKTWRFAPAVKDGRPVRYRKVVQVWRTAP